MQATGMVDDHIDGCHVLPDTPAPPGRTGRRKKSTQAA
jgi:hypothetical protein